MKTSTMFVLLSLGAANLSTAITLPAFAEGNTPTTNSAGNCSTARDNANNKDRLTKPKEGQKMGADHYADDREKLHSCRGNAPAPREKGRRNDNRSERNHYPLLGRGHIISALRFERQNDHPR